MRDDRGMSRTIALPDGNLCLELAETGDDYRASITCRGNESTRWQALPPDGGSDAWVSVTLQGHKIIANSWSGWRVEIDADTGREQGRNFTK